MAVIGCKLKFDKCPQKSIDDFGKIFIGRADFRPRINETVVSTDGDKYLIKDVINSNTTVSYENGRTESVIVVEYVLSKLPGIYITEKW